MATAHEPKAPSAPYVPPIAPEELARRNAEVGKMLDAWDVEENAEQDRETMASLREALGPERTLASRGQFP